MKRTVTVLLALAFSISAATADDITDMQAIGQDEAALISAMRHMLADIGDLNRKLEALQTENAKLKTAKPSAKVP